MKSKEYPVPNPSGNYSYQMKSDKGLVRANNEDYLAVKEFCADKNPALIAVLSDGVGGNKAGEVAAHIGVKTVLETITASESLEDPPALLEKALHKANQAVLDHAAEIPETLGMGATCVCILLLADCLYLANLGDSRAYLFSGGHLQQITHDHTWLADNPDAIPLDLVNVGRSHPLSHVLNRYLGSPHKQQVDLRLQIDSDDDEAKMLTNQGCKLSSGNRLLLCSDGLSDMLSDRKIAKLMASRKLARAAEKLLKAALKAGGHDNTSLIVIEIS